MTADLGPGSSFGPYRLESLLGRGGMSVVYLAEDTRLGRRVAIKVLAPELAADEAFRSRFVRESQLAAGLEHPNIVPVYEAGETDGQLFIAMRYVSGTDLRSLIVHDGPLAPGRTIALLRPVAAALDTAHRRGLVHRDVKPANILIAAGEGEGEEHVYLSDFGLTKHTSSRSGLTRTGQFMGTVDYVAPEQIQGLELDGRADEYSLACVLYECLTARVPYAKDSDVATLFGHIQDPPPRVTESMPDLPGGIDEVIARGMAKDREVRPRSCAALIDEAARALGTPSGRREAPVVPAAPAIAMPAPAVTPPASPPLAQVAAGPAVSPPEGPSPPRSGPPPGGRSSGARLIALFAAAGVAIAAVIVVVGLALTGDDGAEPPPSPSASGPATTGTTGPTGTTAPSPSPAVVADSAPISIPDFGEATPYPASLEVSGLAGTIADVNVTIAGLSHPFPDDLDMLLVGPLGQSVLLMADVGGRQPASAVTITFDDSAPAALGDRARLGSRSARPSSGTALGGGNCCGFEGGPPAPETAPDPALSVFDGTDPNGTWSLFVFDDTGGDFGSIDGGWSLEISLVEAPE